jgi:RNA polymerase sigma factor (sigma-70 family)
MQDEAAHASPLGHEEDLARRLSALRDPLARFFARSVRDPAEVDDLVQDVYLRVVRSGRLADMEYFNRYVFSAADSVLKDRHRSRRVRQTDRHVVFEPEAHAAQEPGPDAGLIARQMLHAAGAALLELPERTRAVFLLRRLDRLSYAQIATQLGLSVSAVEKHMLRATRHLLTSSRAVE